MPQRTDLFDLARLGLTSGEGRRLDLHVHVDPFDYGGSRYAVEPELVPVRLDISRTTGNGWALRLRFDGGARRPVHALPRERQADVRRSTPTRSTSRAAARSCISPYMTDELDLEAWARDALALALPAQLTCRPDCAGLCAQCGANLNEDPSHAHEREPSPRWAKLSELKFE